MQEKVDIAHGKTTNEDIQLEKAERAIRLAEEVLTEGGEAADWLVENLIGLLCPSERAV